MLKQRVLVAALAAVILGALALGVGGSAEAGSGTTSVTLGATVGQTFSVDGREVVNYHVSISGRQPKLNQIVIYHGCYLYPQPGIPYNIGETGIYSVDAQGNVSVSTSSDCRVESFVALAKDPKVPISNVVQFDMP